MDNLYTTLRTFGHVKVREPMSKHTTFKIGGPADYFLTLESTDSAVKALKFLDGENVPYVMVGGGSNMLVHDDGFRGVVLKMNNEQFTISGATVIADAGCVTVDVAQKTIAAGLTGFEWGIGVPGTIGGAVRGNAGAAGGDMKGNVSEVEVYQNGDVTVFDNTHCAFGYRDSVFKHDPAVILRVTMNLAEGDSALGMKTVMDNLQYRIKTQPQGYASIGCIFKNVELKNKELRIQNFDIPNEFVQKGKISAGWLVEQVGMKGAAVGQAQVSERHGNFIVNKKGATAEDVLALIAQIKERVYDTYGITLEEEIQII